MVARPGSTTAARARAGALLREAPDHYALLDVRLIGRLAGFLYCCAGAVAAALLVLCPPTAAGGLGAAGWIPAAVLVASAFLFGGLMIVNTRPLPPVLLFAVAVSGPMMLGALQWLSGPGSAYAQLLILSVVWCGVVLPGRRLASVVAIDTVVIFLPALTSRAWDASTMLPECIATAGIVAALGLVCLIHATRMRDVRRALRLQAQAADSLARIDALTGLGNRRALDETLIGLVAAASRSGRPLSALVGDLDRFKQINDRHGHHDGDRILTAVAATMRDVVRLPDACFRWGGDEFVVLLPDTPLRDAEVVAQRICGTVCAGVTTASGDPVRITFGVAERVEHQTGARLLAIADAALLAAKSAQRA